MVNPLLTNALCVDQPPDPSEQGLLDLYPSCVVTRTMAKKVILNDEKQDVDLTDNFIDQFFNHEISKSISPSLTCRQTLLTTHQCLTTPLHSQMTKVMQSCS